MAKNYILPSWALLAGLLLTSPSARAEDPKYPDGLSGQVPVIQRVSQASPYTVPAGKNLYILNLAGSNHRCGLARVYCYLTATGAANLLNPYLSDPVNPIILGPGTVVASTSAAIAFDLNGFLVAAKVEPVVRTLGPGASYFVPGGMTLQLLRLGVSLSAVAPPNLTVGGVGVSVSTAEPVPVGGGQALVNSGESWVTVVGYLKPQ